MANWNERYLQMAELVGSWSKDPTTKCGAVIVRPDNTVASVGFNGFPKGCSDHESFYNDRELKYARVMHAEVNAILLAREPLDGYTIFTHQAPNIGPSCDRCSAAVIQAGIKKIVHRGRVDNPRWNDSIQKGIDMYNEAGIKVVELDRCS